MGNINCFKKKKHDKYLFNPLSNILEDNNEDNFDEYFNMIKLKVSNFYQENQSNQFNISISLDKKDFNQASTISKKVKFNTNEKFVYWKDYLLEYLIKQNSNENPWICTLINKIEDNFFIKENKWLSLFFWQEFELRTRPDLMTNIQPKIFKYNENAINNTNISNLESTKNINLYVNNEYKEFDKTINKDVYSAYDNYIEDNNYSIRLNSNLSDKFHNSYFGSKQDGGCLESNDNPQLVYKEYRKKVKSYIKIFKQHIYNNEHPINIISNYFVECFTKYINNIIDEAKHLKFSHLNDNSSSKSTNNKPENNKNNKIKKTNNKEEMNNKTIKYKKNHSIKDENFTENLLVTANSNNKIDYNQYLHNKYNLIVDSLQKFILKLQTSLRLMYAKTINYQCFIEEKDEFVNLLCSLIFDNSEFYEALFNFFYLYTEIEVKQFNNKLNLFKDIKPEDICIKKQFCLNDETINYQKELTVKKYNKYIIVSYLIN